MSPVRLNGSTSGYSELSAPAVAGSNTLTLPTGAGSTYQMIRNGATAGSLEFADNITSGTVAASTSGVSVNFLNIPSWVKRVTVMFDGVSTNGTSNLQVQLGDSGGIENSSYVGQVSIATGAVNTLAYSAGFLLTQQNTVATSIYSGAMTITLLNLSSNMWAETHTVGGGSGVNFGGGVKSLSGTLDRVCITTANGTDTFDAGSINIFYE
jgi:hypothetical protein